MKHVTLKMSALAIALSSGTAMAAGKSSGGVDAFIDGLDKNLSVTTNYVWRGRSQSAGVPAVQGGATWNHDSGVSVDLWLSSSAGAFASNEYDITVSYSGKADKIGYEAGIVSYSYPQNSFANIEGTHEFFAGINVNNLNAYLYINPDDNFGDNTYIELSADIKRFNIALGINSNDVVTDDYNQVTATVSLTKDLSLAVSQTDLDGDDTELALSYSVPLK